MKKIILFSLAALLFTACQKATIALSPSPAVQAAWSSSAKFGSFSTGGYTIENDVWGSNPGPQSIWANSFNSWGVWCNHSGGGIKSYPNVDRSIGRSVNSLGTVKSSFNATTPGGCSYDLAYDIWLNGNSFEVMLWYSWSGTQPIAAAYNSSGQAIPELTNQSIGGSSWNVFRRGSVFSFLRNGQSSSGTADVKAVVQWINNRGWYNNPTLTKVQFGWEIINTGGSGKNFQINSYSVTSN